MITYLSREKEGFGNNFIFTKHFSQYFGLLETLLDKSFVLQRLLVIKEFFFFAHRVNNVLEYKRKKEK